MELSDSKKDILKELFNTGVGKACSALNIIVGSPVELSVPDINVFRRDDLIKEFPLLGESTLSSVGQKFSGPFSGTALMVLESQSASKLISLLIDEDESAPDFEAIKGETLAEVGNILLNGIIGTLGNMVDKRFTYSLPELHEGSVDSVVSLGYGEGDLVIILVKTKFNVSEHKIDGDFAYIFEVDSYEKLRDELERLEKA